MKTMGRCKCCDIPTNKVYCSDKCEDIFKNVHIRVTQQNTNYALILKGEPVETDFYRPCEGCGTPLKNPTHNKRWCTPCGDERKRETVKKQTAKRKAKKDAENKTIGSKKPINPMFLVRGDVSSSTRASNF